MCVQDKKREENVASGVPYTEMSIYIFRLARNQMHKVKAFIKQTGVKPNDSKDLSKSAVQTASRNDCMETSMFYKSV